MANMIAASQEAHVIPTGPNVTLLSRPSRNALLPRHRKIAALRTIHEVIADDLGYHLLIKLHPKETDRRVFTEAFPPDSMGKTWQFSRAHPWHLASHSEFAICFASGVPIDLIRLKVPTIAYLDLEGLASFDVPDAPRDRDGRIIHDAFHKDGLVLPASNSDDLRAQAHRIKDDRDAVIESLLHAYRRVFATVDDAIAVVE
ncbi:MAG: hypothetical protein WD079_01625, partial [Phycisphaeraceae bacterium]